MSGARAWGSTAHATPGLHSADCAGPKVLWFVRLLRIWLGLTYGRAGEDHAFSCGKAGRSLVSMIVPGFVVSW